jgi:hypothetical protein
MRARLLSSTVVDTPPSSVEVVGESLPPEGLERQHDRRFPLRLPATP